MDDFSFKPIGYMKSVFHFKNGTPRQSSLCQAARGVLTIDKSVFNNPEHSIDGLQEYSHAWIVFVFHKNNNSYCKAKVKPPRLNGKKLGVFSTRSPYRPNNIGLSLVKIDAVQDASIHFSGIDILDGTPILDIKPYIPDYDAPLIAHDTNEDIESPLKFSTENAACLQAESSKTETQYTDASQALSKSHTDNVSSDHSNSDSHSHFTAADLYGEEKTLLPPIVSLKSKNPTDTVKECLSTISNALDIVETKISSNTTSQISGPNIGANKNTCNLTDSDTEKLPSIAINDLKASPLDDDDNYVSDDLLVASLVDDALCKAMSELDKSNSESDCSDSSQQIREIKGPSDINNDGIELDREKCNTHHFSPQKHSNKLMKMNINSKSDSSTRQKTKSKADNNTKDKVKAAMPIWGREQQLHFSKNENNSTVIAPWLSEPPVRKIKVTFTTDALQQLEKFGKDCVGEKFRLQMLSDVKEAKQAICNILSEEPRSVYRRQHCKDSLYFFALDVIHVTCWFDDCDDDVDACQVVRIKPVADVKCLYS